MARQRRRGIKGAGSVYQRKSDGRWTGSFTVEETGKRKYVYAPIDNNTERAAYDLLQQAMKEHKDGIDTQGRSQKLGAYLEWWLEQVHKHTVRLGTYLRYREFLDHHICPALGTIELGKLTARQVQDFCNKKLKEGLAPKTLHNMKAFLHSACQAAITYHYLTFNPTDGVKLPPNEPVRPGQSLTLEQVRDLLNGSRGHWLEAFVALALTSGMRSGELLSLRWEDVSFEQETIAIHRTISYHAHGHKFVEGPPKTKSSIRTIPLLPMMSPIFEAHRSRQEQDRVSAGSEWQEKGLVFCTRHGGFLYVRNVRNTFNGLLAKIGLPHVPLHDLRHTANTMWKSLGIDPQVRQKMLGHSNLEMTETVYSHVLPSMLEDAIKKMNGLFQPPEVE
jgi:integrase